MEIKKVFSLFLLSVLSFSGLLAQENQNAPSVAIYYTAQYVDYFSPRLPQESNITAWKEHPAYSNTFGLELAIPIHRNLFVNSGFSCFKSVYVFDQVYETQDIGGTNLVVRSKTKFSDYFVQLPVNLQYYFGDKKNRFYLKSGFLLDWNYHRNANSLAEFSNGERQETEGFVSHQADEGVIIVGVLGWGGEFELHRNFRFFLEQETRTGLIYPDTATVNQNRFDLGLRMGFRFIWKDWRK